MKACKIWGQELLGKGILSFIQKSSLGCQQADHVSLVNSLCRSIIQKKRNNNKKTKQNEPPQKSFWTPYLYLHFQVHFEV